MRAYLLPLTKNQIVELRLGADPELSILRSYFNKWIEISAVERSTDDPIERYYVTLPELPPDYRLYVYKKNLLFKKDIIKKILE
jgi:hypothetical protein